MSAGKFISFEGSEGCGKSTQIDMLCETLLTAGHNVVRTREPGGTTLGEKIRQLLQHDPEGEQMNSRAELLLFTASRAQLVAELIKPSLERGAIVVSDRFFDSTTVYQGVARLLPTAHVDTINAFAIDDCEPDLTIYLDIDPVEGMRRVQQRTDGALDRIERENDDFFARVRQGYLELAKTHPQRIRVVDASGAVETVAARVEKTISDQFHGIFERTGI